MLALSMARADSTWQYTVLVSAQVQVQPPQITLVWPQDTVAVPDSYTVFRKAPGASSWGVGTVLGGGTTSLTDTGVAAGTSYEYQVIKTNSRLAYGGSGYICSGINAPLVEARGKIILVVDNTFTAGLAAELARLEEDLAGDGWTVIRRNVSRNDSVVNVKNLIKSDYNADPANVKAVFLFGHVPVPYSGLINPDDHADHYGAWPADAFYADMDGTWSDVSADYHQTANTNPADAARLSNVPGDGKYDQSYIPSPVELQLGRVDLSNLPAFSRSEAELLRQYLDKDHKYRHKNSWLPVRGLVHDSLGIGNGEAYAACSWRNFSPLVGPANITTVPVGQWFPTLASQGYLWAYGCGAGSYASISGLGSSGNYNEGTTWDFAAIDTRATFYLLCGSWHGDWDSPNNIMRGALATQTFGLACVWAGIPQWYLHPMGLGETLGYCARLTQNNSTLYRNQINHAAGCIHIALLGDPTLRLYPVAPPTALAGSMGQYGAGLNWNPSADPVLGYLVYRAPGTTRNFVRIAPSMISGTSFTDTSVNSGMYTYMVRAVRLETTPSGSYYNPSQGAFLTVSGSGPDTPVVTVYARNADVSESGGQGIFTLGRTGSTAAPLTVYFALGGTADNGVDYEWKDFSATIPAGAASVEVLIAPVDDAQVEGTETVILTLSTDAAYSVGSPNEATVSIRDNDSGADPSATVVWMDDAIPAGAWGGADGGDVWQWQSANPASFSGALSHQSAAAAGLHYHYFADASARLAVNAGDTLFAYVYLDPANPPREIMLQWFDGSSWSHRAYWGENLIAWGANGTASQRPIGGLPPAGRWVALEVPASSVGLDGSILSGMNFILYNGRAAWDYCGKSSTAAQSSPDTTTPAVAITAPANNSTATGAVTLSAAASDDVGLTGVQFKLDGLNLGSVITAAPYDFSWNTTSAANGAHTLTVTAVDAAGNQGVSSPITVTVNNGTTSSSLWVDDAVPEGAWTGAEGGDSWTWVTTNPAPSSGTRAHQSSLAAGVHCHYFVEASTPLIINSGDSLVAYVFLDPASPPREIMLQWFDGSSWSHAAYWGENLIPWGANGTASQRPMGPLSPAGQWVRLAVPASLVDLAGRSVFGMNFILYDGRATWDRCGKSTL